jgi:hypothetical protein
MRVRCVGIDGDCLLEAFNGRGEVALAGLLAAFLALNEKEGMNRRTSPCTYRCTCTRICYGSKDTYRSFALRALQFRAVTREDELNRSVRWNRTVLT